MPLRGDYLAHGNDQQRRTTALLQAVANLQSATDLLIREALIMGQVNPGAGSPQDLEALYTLEAGQGQEVQNVVTSAAEALRTNGFIQGLLQRLG